MTLTNFADETLAALFDGLADFLDAWDESLKIEYDEIPLPSNWDLPKNWEHGWSVPRGQ